MNVHSRNYFFFDDISSADFDLVATAKNPYASPKRSTETIHIFGNDAPYIIDNGRFENIVREYEIGLIDNLPGQTQRVRDWLYSIYSRLSAGQYIKFGDTYNDRHYLRVYDIMGLEDFLQDFNRVGKGTIGFLCDAYRYLRIGGEPYKIGGSTGNTHKLLNPTAYKAYPYIDARQCRGITLKTDASVLTIEDTGQPVNIVVDCQRRIVLKDGKPALYTLKIPLYNGVDNFLLFSVGETTLSTTADITLYKNWREI